MPKRGDIQFAALPWRIGAGGRREVMLLTSRETRRWIIPKGWPMPGKKPAQVASQEAFEEAGLLGKIVGKRPLGNYFYQKKLPKKEVLTEVFVYSFRVEQQLDDWPEKDQRVTQWFDATDAAALIEEGGLAGIIERFAGASVRFVRFSKRRSPRPRSGPPAISPP